MTDSIFNIALEKRFTDSAEVATINVTSADTLLIRDSETGAIMRLPFSTLATISSAFSSSFASLVDGKVPASLAAATYQKFKSGFIIQQGSATVSGCRIYFSSNQTGKVASAVIGWIAEGY